MTNRPKNRPTPARTQSQSSGLSVKWLLLSIVVACTVGALAIWLFERDRARMAELAKVREMIFPKTPLPIAATEPPVKPNTAPVPGGVENLIDDDGTTLWASPTSGRPLDLAYLPPGSQIILAVRPADLSKHGEGAKVLAALGPLGQRAIQYLESAMFLRIGDMESLVISCQATSSGEWLTAMVAHVRTPYSLEPLTKLSGATTQSHAGKKYLQVGDRAYFVPEEREGRVLVVAPPTLIVDTVELAGAAPPLRRDVERLLAHTDTERQFTVIVAPNFLFSEGQGMFSGPMARMRGPLFWFLGDGLSAAALSMNWDENFFVELVAMPTLDVSPEKMSGELSERVRQMPDLMEDYVLRLDPQPYGRRVVARFPGMVRKLAAYTRSGVEDGAAVLRCYLPATAGHNLVMGAELTSAEVPGAGATATDAPIAKVPVRESTSPSVHELLARKTSLSFARDSLEAALEQLSLDIGVEFIIVGPDLQADGITRNQQLAMDIKDKPAGEILVEILRKANPDKTATGPTDLRQKLVYVVKPKSVGEEEAVFVTTRAGAAERGEELPALFRP